MSKRLMQDLDEQTFNRLRTRIQAHSGLYLDDSRRRSLARLIASRLAHHDLHSESEYLALLESKEGTDEMVALLEDVVNNETTFFRNPRHFRLLAEVVLPELDRARPDKPLRLWSAGCSTGQEPYSLAITVAEVLGLPPRRPVQILATDISRRALEYARRGFYSAREIQRVENHYRENYFRAKGQGFQVHQELQDLIQFQELNLVSRSWPPTFHGLDVIFCRNVTIYFQVQTSQQLMANLYRKLNEGGYLFIGFSETLWQIFDSFERVQNGGVFFYRKGPAVRPQRPVKAAPPPRSVPGGASVERPLYLGTPPSEQPAATKIATAPRRVVREEDPARVYYHQGMNCLRDGVYEEALAAFRAALREEPNLVEAYCGIAQVYANQGLYPQALQACERALELDDLAEEAYLLRGLIHRQVGKTKEAITDLERASYLNPSSPTAHFYLGDTFLSLSNNKRAMQSFRRTWRTLLGRPDDALIDGVPVHLLRDACRRHMEALTTSPGKTYAGTTGQK